MVQTNKLEIMRENVILVDDYDVIYSAEHVALVLLLICEGYKPSLVKRKPQMTFHPYIADYSQYTTPFVSRGVAPPKYLSKHQKRH